MSGDVKIENISTPSDEVITVFLQDFSGYVLEADNWSFNLAPITTSSIEIKVRLKKVIGAYDYVTSSPIFITSNP